MEESEAINAGEEPNSYLALRDAKIARNHARLQELGLIKLQSRKRATKMKIPTKEISLKRQKQISTLDSSSQTRVQPERRSLRIRKFPIDEKVEPIISRIPLVTEPIALEQLTNIIPSEFLEPQRRVHDSSKNSARDIHLDIDRLLFGALNDSNDGGLLGVQLAATGKAFVIEESVRRASNIVVNGRVSFNKYCGAQEWGGNVLYLWINFDSPDSEIVNKFDNNGRHVNWFGGSKMHDETPLIKKLKYVGVQAAQRVLESKGAIILWCRKYNKAKKSFDPYVCLGRLSLVSYDPTSHPVQFIWNLIDYENLLENKSELVQQTFQKMISSKIS